MSSSFRSLLQRHLNQATDTRRYRAGGSRFYYQQAESVLQKLLTLVGPEVGDDDALAFVQAARQDLEAQLARLSGRRRTAVDEVSSEQVDALLARRRALDGLLDEWQPPGGKKPN